MTARKLVRIQILNLKMCVCVHEWCVRAPSLARHLTQQFHQPILMHQSVREPDEYSRGFVYGADFDC